MAIRGTTTNVMARGQAFIDELTAQIENPTNLPTVRLELSAHRTMKVHHYQPNYLMPLNHIRVKEVAQSRV